MTENVKLARYGFNTLSFRHYLYHFNSETVNIRKIFKYLTGTNLTFYVRHYLEEQNILDVHVPVDINLN
jgi:hypothetical protein